MSQIARRVCRLLLCGSSSHAGPDLGAEDIFLPSSHNEQNSATPKAVHQSKWSDFEAEGGLVCNGRRPLDHFGGLVVLLLLGSPGIGKASLQNKVRSETPNFHGDTGLSSTY